MYIFGQVEITENINIHLQLQLHFYPGKVNLVSLVRMVKLE